MGLVDISWIVVVSTALGAGAEIRTPLRWVQNKGAIGVNASQSK